MKVKFNEVSYPKYGVTYWVVYDPSDESFHYFKDKFSAFEFSSWNCILDINVFQECFN